MLNLVQSNRIDALADRLAARLCASPPAVFETEVVVVPSAAIGRWLDFRLGASLGVAAGIEYPFPAAYVWTLFSRVLPDLPRSSPFDPELMTWRLARHLRRLPADSVFEPVRRYVKGGDVLARYDLGRVLAEQFDRYAAYRPEWLEAWLAGRREGLGDHEAWQAGLWRALAADQPELPHVHPKQRFFDAITHDPAARARLPSRVSLFAVDALAPLYLEVFQRLAEHVDLTLYLVNPSGEYWGDIERPSTVARAAAQSGGADHRESGHRLFGALGQHGRELFDRLVELEPAATDDAFVPAGGRRLLGVLQNDILELHDRGPDERITIAADDRSIEIHACHGEVREAEVLHDLLLDRFAADPRLQPEDVLVLCPDLETYAPAIEAVFSSVPPERFIPFSIADRAGDAERPLVRSLVALVAAARGRLDAASVTTLLDEPRIAARFGLEPDDVPLVREWVVEAGIRWGEDERSRTERGLPATREFSWRAGLDRLVLGAALSSDVSGEVAGIVPFGEIEGAGTERLGALHAFFDALAAFARELANDRPMAAWMSLFTRAIDGFHALAPDEADDARIVREALATIAERTTRAGFDEPVPADLAWRHVERVLATLGKPASFLAGGVTVARLAAGRIVPAGVVCVIGLNDGVFPGNDRPRGFDLIAARPRRGDRRRRDEDRQAFLGALLAARDAFIVTYTGFSVRDNAPLPPSTTLGDLYAALSAGFVAASGSVVDHVFVPHPLQPGSARYFAGAPRHFTYAEEWRPHAASAAPEPFAAGAAIALPEDREIELDRLIRALQDPSRFFLRDRLGIVIRDEDPEIAASEPFAIDTLEGYDFRDRLLGARLGRGDAAEVERSLRAAGRLPAGTIGEALLAAQAGRCEPIVEAIRKAVDDDLAWCEPVTLDIAVRGWRVKGRLDQLVARGQVRWRAGKMNARTLIDAWVRHLALCVAAPEGIERVTIVVADKGKGRAHTLTLPAIPKHDALDTLGDLVALMEEAATRALPFHPEPALAYVNCERARDGDPRAKALKSWVPNPFAEGRAESERAYVALATRDDPDPLGEAFVVLARRVFGPLLDASEGAGDAAAAEEGE